MIAKLLLSSLISLVAAGNIFALEVGDMAPCVFLENLNPNGTKSDTCIREREGDQKYTLLEFFSIYCGACQVNLPKINRLGHELSTTTKTRFIAIDRNSTMVTAYIDRNPLISEFTVALDSERNAKRAYEIFQTPTMFILDDTNRIIYKHIGVLSESSISEIRELLDQ